MRLTVCLTCLLLLTGCGGDAPAEPAAPAPAPAAAPSDKVSERVPADHVLQPQLQALDKARAVQELADEAKERIDDAADEPQP